MEEILPGNMNFDEFWFVVSIYRAVMLIDLWIFMDISWV